MSEEKGIVTHVKNNKSIINAWCSYDWANSVYSLTVTSTIFPVYYSAATREAFGGEMVDFFGWTVKNTVLYSYAISFSFLVIVFFSPILSGIADYSGRKKRFMQVFTYMGAFSCLGLYFFTGPNIGLGLLFSVLASIGYAGALVFYNAFLPEISTPDKMDKISAKGFSMGYIGSVILLILSLVMITYSEELGFSSKSSATRFSFLMVGVWWMAFAQIAFFYLKDHPFNEKKAVSELLTKGIRELRSVLKEVRKYPVMPKYLLAFLFYSVGVQTIMLLAPLFGESVIRLSGEKLIITVLLLQLVAIAGSYLFAFISSKRSNKTALIIMVVIWIGICGAAYNLQTEAQFFIMAGFVGLVMGGIQAISRSTYSKMIPQDTEDTASYFSLYDVTEKVAIVVGTFSYGLVEQITGDMRFSALSLSFFFIVGLVILALTKMPNQQEKAIVNKIIKQAI